MELPRRNPSRLKPSAFKKNAIRNNNSAPEQQVSTGLKWW